MNQSNKEYEILEIINDSSSHVSQRELAQAADLSLGMTNAVLKKLVMKGLLVMKRINSRNIRYALTAEGMAEVAHRSEALLKRTLGNVAAYRSAVEDFVTSHAQKGVQAICLKGPSDLDFIVEWACMKHHVAYNPLQLPQFHLVLDDETLISSLQPYIRTSRGQT